MAIQLKFKCSESWDKMTNSDKGKFCDKCTKNVFDLTDKSDTEIKQLYTENNGKMCGRIKQSQIGLPFMSAQKRMLAKFCMALYLVFGGFLFNYSVNAQNLAPNSLNKTEDVENIYILKGKVIDSETLEQLPFASVSIFQDSVVKGVLTDLNGDFVIELSKEELKGTKFSLRVTYVGFLSFEKTDIELDDISSIELDIVLEDDEIILMGDVWIEEPPILNKDPNSHGETIIDKDEIKRSPY